MDKINLTFDIFHLEKSGGSYKARTTLTNRVIDELSKHYPRFNCGTVNLIDNDNYKDFLNTNPEFKVNNKFKKGEIGVWASNYLAWKKFVDSPYEYLLLFEDDVELYEGFVNSLNFYMKYLPKDWDIFSVFCADNQRSRYKRKKHYVNESISKGYQDWSMLSYVVSRSGAIKMLEHIKKNEVIDPVDWFIFRNGHKDIFNVYTLSPHVNQICGLLNLKSTIQDIEERIEI
jgi:GR25 family glycosyltransferase involved in LPS biosynthesis